MFRRISSVSRPVAAQLARPAVARGFAKSVPSAVSASDIVLQLEAKKIGSEIRKRGLSNAVANNTRDGGMDRVCLALPRWGCRGGFISARRPPTPAAGLHRRNSCLRHPYLSR